MKLLSIFWPLVLSPVEVILRKNLFAAFWRLISPFRYSFFAVAFRYWPAAFIFFGISVDSLVHEEEDRFLHSAIIAVEELVQRVMFVAEGH